MNSSLLIIVKYSWDIVNELVKRIVGVFCGGIEYFFEVFVCLFDVNNYKESKVGIWRGNDI